MVPVGGVLYFWFFRWDFFYTHYLRWSLFLSRFGNILLLTPDEENPPHRRIPPKEEQRKTSARSLWGKGVPFCRHWSSQWTFRGALGHRGIPTGHAALPNVKLTFDPV